MKAKELLKEIVKAYPDVRAIAQDRNGYTFTYTEIPINTKYHHSWHSEGAGKQISHANIIEWDSENWKENIVTINDLENESN